MIEVTYLHHSGYLVETENYCLLFDYYTQNGRYHLLDIGHQANKTNKQWIIFASHAHGDHFDNQIFKVGEQLHTVAYVLSDDIENNININKEIQCPKENMLFVSPDKKYEFKNISIQTLRSNDEGVAFLVVADSHTIYHAGDLNWWHWNGESKQFNDEIAKSYQGEIDKLKGTNVDVAFIPVDNRLEDKYILGLDYFMKQVGAKWAFPMHFWRKFEICEQIQNDLLAKSYKQHVMKITKANELFVLK